MIKTSCDLDNGPNVIEVAKALCGLKEEEEGFLRTAMTTLCLADILSLDGSGDHEKFKKGIENTVRGAFQKEKKVTEYQKFEIERDI